MLVLKNTFLELPLRNAMDFYQALPKVSQRNKVVAISVAVALSLITFIRERVKPPKSIRHIPYINFMTSVKSIIKEDSVWKRAYNIHLPQMHSSKGIFSEYTRTGWSVNISNPEDAKKVLLKLDAFPKTDQVNIISNTLSGKFLFGPNMLFLNGHAWKSQRKVANPAFNRSMPVNLFGRLTQDMFRAMEQLGETINVSDMMERLTLDVIGKAGFDFDFEAVKNRKSKWVMKYNSIKYGMRDPLFFLFPSLDTTFLWMFPKRKILHQNMAEFLEMLDDIIKHKRRQIESGNTNDALEDNEKDLLSLMIESKEEDGKMSDLELKSNLCFFFLAGHDSTSHTLAYIIHYLAEHPAIQEKAREEAIDILGNDSFDVIPNTEDIKKMTYITQIIKETLRINSPVIGLSPRTAAEDTYLSDTFIPKGTQVNVNVFNMHHDDNLWEDSETFNPDRFSESSEHKPGAWIPFGNGGRKCVGMNFGIAEQRVILSMMLRKYTWETPADSIHKNGLICNTVGLVGPIDLDITFHKRY